MNIYIMKNIFVLIVFWWLSSLATCAKSNQLDSLQETPALKIVELVAKGSFLVNEFGERTDWIKLENVSNDTIRLSDHKIYISDNVNRPRKYRLKKKIIPPGGNLVIWCDGENIIKEQIHTNFKLSSLGEIITISIKNASNIEILDQVRYERLGAESQVTMVRTSEDLLEVIKPN